MEVARRHADGIASDEELNEAARAASMSISREAYGRNDDPQALSEHAAAALASNATQPLDRTPTQDSPDGWVSLCTGGWSVSDFLIDHTLEAARELSVVSAKLTDILRDVCGNPFRPVAVNPSWQTLGLQALAQAIYDADAFDRLPELDAALEEAGCDEPAILEHCRLPGSHVRGCWVLDLVLGHPRPVDPTEPRTPWWGTREDEPA